MALFIGTVELLGLVAEKAGLHGAFWDWGSGLDLNIIGYVIVGMFFATWAIALVDGGSGTGTHPRRTGRRVAAPPIWQVRPREPGSYGADTMPMPTPYGLTLTPPRSRSR